MKWAQLKDVLDGDGVEDVNERKKLFREYKTKQELKDDLDDPAKFVKWVTYPDDDPLQKPFALNRKAQRRYEVFCGGFLYYHDVELKKYPEGKDANGKVYPNKDFDHNIYFEWFPKEKGNKEKTKVIIHITPTPPEFNPNPPPPPAPPPPESNP